MLSKGRKLHVYLHFLEDKYLKMKYEIFTDNNNNLIVCFYKMGFPKVVL